MKETEFETDFGEASLIFGIVLLIIFFAGEPDLVDALVNYFMNSK